MNNKFEDDGFSITNVSLLDENLSYSSPRDLTSSPSPISNFNRSNEARRYSTINVEDLEASADCNMSEKDTRAGPTSLKSQENVSLTIFILFLLERLSDIFLL